MYFHSLAEILTKIPEQPGWEKYQQYCQLVECWQAIVSPKIAKQTRPLYIKRQVLWVATSSSVWAQELSFQRYILLQKLNSRLALSLKDIRFTTYQGQQQTSDRSKNNPNNQEQHLPHPSSVKLNNISLPSNNLPVVNDPQTVVKNWLNALQQRSLQLSVCPQCKSPTPEGELKRWHLCCHCAAKHWDDK